MSTISVPLNARQEGLLEGLISSGVASNKAEVMRKALEKYAEDEAVRVVLEASRSGVFLKGDIDELAAQLPD